MKTKSNFLIKFIQTVCFAVLPAVFLFVYYSLPDTAMWGGLGGPSDPVPVMESLRTGVLPSGLRYYILENSMPENRAYLTLVVKAGSVLEEDDEQGLAHFVEHLAFNGTERFPESKLVSYLRSLGMRFGPEVNAYTSFDQTVYGIEVPVENDGSGVRRIPDTALAVIDDWTRAITFAPADVDDERPVIIEEYRTRLGAWERLRRKWLPVLFRGSPYANRMPIGLPEIIEGAPASRLEGFFKKWYRADNMALILVGDFDGAALEASLTDHFLIEKPAAPTNRPLFDLPLPQKGNVEVLTLTDPELTATSIYLYIKRNPQARRDDLSHYRSEIIDYLIDTMLSIRFEEALLKPETPHVNLNSGIANYATSSRFYVFTATAKTGVTEASLEDLLKIKETMSRYGFTDSEIATAGEILISDLQKMVQEKDKQQSQRFINTLTDYYLTGGNYANIEWELNAVSRMLPHIRARDINAAVKNYFALCDINVFIFAPDSEQDSLPDEARIRQMIAESSKIKIAAPKSKTVEGGLLSPVPERGSVVSESIDAETGAIVWGLSNGSKVILKSTKNKNDEVVMHAMAIGGTSSAAPEDDVSASLSIEMTQVSGLGPWSRPELTIKLAGKQVSLSQFIYSYYRGFRGSSNTVDLKTFFEMIHLSFINQRIDNEAVQAMMDQYRTSLALKSEDPHAAFSYEINKTIYGGHPHFKPLELNDLPKADIDTALAFVRKCQNPADYTFIFTGNLDLKTMREYVETYLASIPRGNTWNTLTDLNVTRPGKIEKIVYKGKEEQSTVYMAWFSQAPFSDELSAACQVLNEYLDIKLDDEIREKLGGVYSISSSVAVTPVPQGELSMQVYFNCDPKRARELQTAVIAELNQVANGVIDLDTFTKAVEAPKKEWEVSIQSNAYIAQSYANSSVLLKLPLSRLDKRPKLFDAVTQADIQRVCRQLLQSNGPTIVMLLPENR
ncbi:MAG: insulinase family protein [Treponema sp.]|jgi:zinc protease|nr:insulinase family protein [Treponema sp.]